MRHALSQQRALGGVRGPYHRAAVGVAAGADVGLPPGLHQIPYGLKHGAPVCKAQILHIH